MLATPSTKRKANTIRSSILQFIKKYFGEDTTREKTRIIGRIRAIFHILGDLYAEVTGKINPALENIRAKTQYGKRFPADFLEIVRLNDEPENETIKAVVEARLAIKQKALARKRRAVKSYTKREKAEITGIDLACPVPVTSTVVATPNVIIPEVISAASSLFIQTSLGKSSMGDVIDSWFAPSPHAAIGSIHSSMPTVTDSTSPGLTFWDGLAVTPMQVSDQDGSALPNTDPNSAFDIPWRSSLD
jgi:hypothetical protein